MEFAHCLAKLDQQILDAKDGIGITRDVYNAQQDGYSVQTVFVSLLIIAVLPLILMVYALHAIKVIIFKTEFA